MNKEVTAAVEHGRALAKDEANRISERLKKNRRYLRTRCRTRPMIWLPMQMPDGEKERQNALCVFG